jgi:hypothetical protein
MGNTMQLFVNMKHLHFLLCINIIWCQYKARYNHDSQVYRSIIFYCAYVRQLCGITDDTQSQSTF